MKRLIWVIAALLLFTFTASAQYAECQQCRTWREDVYTYTYPREFLGYGYYADCEVAPVNGLSGYTYCYVDMYANCGTQPRPGRTNNDFHCHIENPCTTYEAPPCCGSPIAVKLSNGPWALTGIDDPVRIDLTGDGVEAFAWSARDSDIAFIVYDANGNGAVDNGSEMFGTWGGRISGFEALAEFDENYDGILNDEDEHAWPALQLWVDRNHNGRSEPDELSGIGTSQIEWLDLEYRMTDREDKHGNKFKYVALAGFRDGGRRPYYDLFFRRVTAP